VAARLLRPGAERPLAGEQTDVHDKGFVQPSDLPNIFAQAGVFILPSRYEPWGVVIGEALASGLP